jgi:hypothetical protein
MLPPFIKVKVSMLKDENVVNPPKNPTVNNNRKDSGSILVDLASDSKIPITSAIRKLPTVFTNNVPKGNIIPNLAPMAVVAI